MERYIDADKFIERLKASPAFPNMGMDGYFLLDVVENLLKKFPTADVAPKSEVAREIFEEIEKIIDKHHGECYEYEDGDECDTAITYISYISCDIAELKKKYTEERE
jgi:hypothetical protein